MKNTSKINTVLLIIVFLTLNACRKQKIEKNACKSDHLELRADSAYIIAPNIFTPNGNNINDKFTLNMAGIKNISMHVYNKRGEIIWGEAITGPFTTSWWTGKHNAGRWEGKTIDGVYDFEIKATTNSGVYLHGEGTITCVSDPAKYCLKEMNNAYFPDGSQGEKESFCNK
jgi:hypothetical protein